MSIYLAWSIYKLVGCLIFAALLVGLLWYGSSKLQDKGAKKATKVLAGFLLLTILGAAFNIGDRQQSLQRSSFNATLEESPAYVPPPPDILKETRTNFEKSILEIQPKKESNQ